MGSESHVIPESHDLNPNDHLPRSGEEVAEEGNESSGLFPNASQEKVVRVDGKQTRTIRNLENSKQFIGLAEALITPIVAIGYLAFCYTVLTRAVPVNLGPLINTSPENLCASHYVVFERAFLDSGFSYHKIWSHNGYYHHRTRGTFTTQITHR
jgi:hypothetical protein